MGRQRGGGLGGRVSVRQRTRDKILRIGIDFDNTIAGYDHLFLAIARERGLLPESFAGSKKSIRDAIRARPNGELAWTELQGVVYGARMADAEIIAGVAPFLSECRRRGIPVRIVSHKTRFAARDPLNVNLHDASTAWLEAHGFFDRFGIARDMVFFEPTREDKCRRIGALQLSHFIDDLEEVFHEPSFPDGVERYLLDAEGGTSSRFKTFTAWRDIQDDIFGAR
jgi:hypothetical protein